MLLGKEYHNIIATMVRKVGHIIRIFFLFLYVVYALTPVHMYATTGYSGRSSDLCHPRTHASTDVVWVNILFSSLIDDVEAPSTGARIFINAQQSGDVILVKKRGALVREQFDGKPLFDTKSLSPGGLERLSARSLEYEIAKNPLLRETEGCFTLNTGLSPPSLIS